MTSKLLKIFLVKKTITRRIVDCRRYKKLSFESFTSCGCAKPQMAD